MTAAITLPCTAGGRTVITWNIVGVRTGSDNDRSQWRIVRRPATLPEVALIGSPDITMTARQDTRSWTWIDDNIPQDGTYTYQLQIQRIAGGGVIYEMVLLGQHFKR